MFHLVAVAASAGGLPALEAVLGALPPTFRVPIVVVQHLDPASHSLLAQILARRTKLKVMQGADGLELEECCVYVAPPGVHTEICVDDGHARIRLVQSEPTHFLRPSADRLFQSAATSWSPILGVVLTGNGSDGADGVHAIKVAGGIVIAQDEHTALFAGMPRAAIATGEVDYILPLNEIGPALLRLTAGVDDDEIE